MIGRRQFVLLAGALALGRFGSSAAQEATPNDAGESILGGAQREFRAPGSATTGTLSLTAVALLFDAAKPAAKAFPVLFGAVVGQMDAVGDGFAAVDPPPLGDEVMAAAGKVAADAGGEVDSGAEPDVYDIGVVGYRDGGAILVVVATAKEGDAIGDAIATAERVADRLAAPSATPVAGDAPRADGAFAFLPTLADAPAGMTLFDENGFPEDAGTPVP